MASATVTTATRVSTTQRFIPNRTLPSVSSVYPMFSCTRYSGYVSVPRNAIRAAPGTVTPAASRPNTANVTSSTEMMTTGENSRPYFALSESANDTPSRSAHAHDTTVSALAAHRWRRVRSVPGPFVASSAKPTPATKYGAHSGTKRRAQPVVIGTKWWATEIASQAEAPASARFAVSPTTVPSATSP